MLTLKFRPQGVVSPGHGAIYMYKVMKKMYKMLTLKFRPKGVVSPGHGAIYMYKIMKKNV